jgi:hypothetical protein
MEPDPPPHSIECSHPPANVCLGQQFSINVVATHGQHKKYISRSCTSSGRYMFSPYRNIIILNTKKRDKENNGGLQSRKMVLPELRSLYIKVWVE